MSTPERPEANAGHVSIRPEGMGPRDTLFTFQTQKKRFGGAVGVSMAAHVAVIVGLFLAARYLPDEVVQAVLPDKLERVIFIPSPGPGGGGGGGNKMPDPPKPAEIPKPKPVEMKPPEVIPPPEVVPTQQVLALNTEVPNEPAPGALSNTANSDSRGSGVGSGAGPGTGSGLGPGSGGGFGGGPMRVGNGVSSPIPISQPQPQYTPDAMRARVQGVAVVECTVRVDGTVGDCQVTRSVDSSFGLDGEAIKAAQRWRFRPSMFQGQPVPVRILIEMTFTLR